MDVFSIPQGSRLDDHADYNNGGSPTDGISSNDFQQSVEFCPRVLHRRSRVVRQNITSSGPWSCIPFELDRT